MHRFASPRHSGGAVLCLGLLGALAAAVCAQRTEPEGEAAERAFRRAFTDPLTPHERVRELERIVKERPDSDWADDALWVLGEAARRQQLTYRVIYYWQYMMARSSQPRLEEHTRTLDVYRKSSLSRVRYLLEAEGTAFLVAPIAPAEPGDDAAGAPPRAAGPDAPSYLACRPFNAVPMVVWAELAACYERLRKPRLAVAAYTKALASAPPASRWSKAYRERAERLEKLVALLPPPDGSSVPRDGAEAETPPPAATASADGDEEPKAQPAGAEQAMTEPAGAEESREEGD